MVKPQQSPTFDGFRAIASHIEQRKKFECFICGQSEELPDPRLTNCNADCLCAQWLHSPGPKDGKVVELVNQVCGACEVFQSMASQAVTLTSIGQSDMAKEILAEGGTYSAASAEFQRKLAMLHSTIAC